MDYRARTHEVNDHTYAARSRHPGTVRVAGATFTRLGPDGLVVDDVHLTDLAGLLRQITG